MILIAGVIILVFLVALTLNYIHDGTLNISPRMFAGEEEQFRFKSNWGYKKTEKVITSQRYFFQKFIWLFNYMKFKELHLDNLDSYLIYRSTNIFILAAAFALLHYIPPAGYMLGLYAVTSILIIVVLRLTRSSWSSPLFWISSLQCEKSLFKRILLKFDEMRTSIRGKSPIRFVEEQRTEFLPAFDNNDAFSFGKAVPVVFFVFSFLAVIQRLLFSHIALDNLLFSPLYLALPAVFAICFGARSGFLSGFLGFWLLYSLMIPFTFKSGLNDFNLLPDGSNTPWLMFLGVSLALGLIAFCTGYLSRRGAYSGPFTVLLWLIPALIFFPVSLSDAFFWAAIIITAGLIWMMQAFLNRGLTKDIEKAVEGLKKGKGRLTAIFLVIALVFAYYLALDAKISGKDMPGIQYLERELHGTRIGESLTGDTAPGTRLVVSLSRSASGFDRLYLNGRAIDHNNGSEVRLEIEPGSHRLDVRTEGFPSVSYRFLILKNEQKRIQVALRERIGALNLDSQPRGARIFLGGREIGRTPMLINNLAAGSYSVKYVMDGDYLPVERTYQVEVGKTLEDILEIGAIPGTLKVTASSGAVVTVDGARISNELKLSPGKYIVNFSFPSAWGVRDVQKSVTILSNKMTEVSHFFPGTGSLQISCNPLARIYIDDIFFRDASAVSLPRIIEGEHTIRIKKDGYADYYGTFQIIAGGTSRMVFNYNFAQKRWVKREG